MKYQKYIDEFEEKFGLRLSFIDAQTGTPGRENLKQFLLKSLSSRDEEIVEMVEGLKKDWMEKMGNDEAKAYNQALSEVSAKLKERI